MFLTSKRRGYNRHDEQIASGKFLLVFQHESKLYGIVRHVHLSQFGHFMMGYARIQGQSVIVSGAYGGDGLPMLDKEYEKLSEKGKQQLVELPAELTKKFWAGGGHNSTGSEAPAMREWAIQTFGVGRVSTSKACN